MVSEQLRTYSITYECRLGGAEKFLKTGKSPLKPFGVISTQGVEMTQPHGAARQ